MMTYLRGHVSKAIFALLLVTFLTFTVIGFGMKGKFGGGGGSAATVNGEKVSSQEFWMIYNQELEGTWQPMRASMNEGDEKALRGIVADRLVDQTLIWQESRRLNYAVSKAEVDAAIKQMPVFMNPQGQFEALRYQAALNRLGVSPDLFEMEQSRAMSAGRLEAFYREAVRVTDLELWLEYLRWHRRMKAELVRFPLAEAKAKQAVTADEVKEYWNANRKEFEKQEKVRIRHIVVAANPQAGPEAAAQAKAKMESILAELKGGADFADVARRKSDDANTAPRGGDLGWRVKGELIPEYDAVVFKLGAKRMSEVFQTKFGFHLIKCDDHQREERPGFDEVKGKIRDRMLTAKAKRALGEEVTRAGWLAKTEKDLGKIAAAVGRKTVATGWFDWDQWRKPRDGAPPAGLSVKQAEELIKALSGIEPGEVSEVIETDEGWVIAKLVDEKHLRAAEAGFLKDRAIVEPVLLARKQRAAYDAWLAALRAKAKIRKFAEAS